MTDFGDASIDVRLDTKEADSQLQKLTADIRAAARTIESRNPVVKIETDAATKKANELFKVIRNSIKQIEALDTDLNLSTEDANQAIKGLVVEARTAARQIEALDFDLNLDTSNASQEVRDLVRELRTAAAQIDNFDPEFDVVADAARADIRSIATTHRQVSRQIEGDQITPKVNASRAKAEINDLARTIRRVVGAAVIGQGLQAFARQVESITGFAIGAVGELENLRVGLQGLNEELGGTSPITDRFISDLKNIAVNSTIAFDTLASSAQKFRATFGAGFDSTGLVQTLGDVNALLGGSSNTFDRAALALTQISAKGVQLEEINQLREALPGFDALGAIAEARGTSVAQTFKDIEARAVTGAEGIRILVAAMEEYPGAAGAMERQTQTLTGSIQNLQTVLKFTAASAFGPFGAAISLAVGALKEASQEGGPIADIFTNVNDVFASTVESALPNLIPAIVSLGDAFVILTEGLAPLVTELGPDLASRLPQLAGLVVPLVDAFISLVDASLPLVDVALPTLLVSLEAVASVLEIMGPLLPVVVTGLISLRAAALLTSTSMGSVAKSLPAVVSGIGQMGAALASAPIGPGATRLGALSSVLGQIPDRARTAGTALGVAAAGVGAYAAASQEGAAKVAGFASAITGIAVGFAVGGPIGGALAVGAAAVGYFAGESAKAKKEAAELEAAVTSLAEIIRTELGPSIDGVAISLDDLFANREIRDQIFDFISPEVLDQLDAAGLKVNDLLNNLDGADISTFEGFSEAARRLNDELGVETRTVQAGDRQGVVVTDAVNDLTTAYEILQEAKRAAFAPELNDILSLRFTGQEEEAVQRGIDLFLQFNNASEAAAALPKDVFQTVFGDSADTVDGYIQAALQIEAARRAQTSAEEADAARVVAARQSIITQLEEEDALRRSQFDGLVGQLAAVKVEASAIQLSGLSEDELDTVQEGLEEIQELINGFATGVAGNLIPGLSGTIDIIRSNFDALQAEIELPEGVEAPEFTVSVRAVIDQFEINQENARAVTDQFQSLITAGFDNITFNLGELIAAGDTESADQLLADLFPDGQLNVPLAAEFDAALAQNSAAQAAFVAEWTTIANTIAPILGAAIAAELSAVLNGGSYAVMVQLDAETSALEIALAATNLTVPVGVEISAASLEALASTDLGAAAGILQVSATQDAVQSAINARVDIQGNVIVDQEALARQLTNKEIGVLLNIDENEVDAFLNDPSNLTAKVQIDTESLRAQYEQDPLLLETLLELDRTELDALFDPANTAELPATVSIDPQTLLGLAETLTPIELQTLLGAPNEDAAVAALAALQNSPITTQLIEPDPQPILDVTTPTYQTPVFLDANGVINNAPSSKTVPTVLDANGRVSNVPSSVRIDAVVSAVGGVRNLPARIFIPIAVADGGVFTGPNLTQTYRDGGIAQLERYANGGEAHVAQIAQGQVPFRVWAEPETGGEAYIPLSPMKRARSEEILGIVADKFGKEIVEKGQVRQVVTYLDPTAATRGADAAGMMGLMDLVRNMVDEVGAQKKQMKQLATALAQMPPITVQAAGGSPENAASKIFWGQRKRLASAGAI